MNGDGKEERGERKGATRKWPIHTCTKSPVVKYMRPPGTQALEVLSNGFFFLCVRLQPQPSMTGSVVTKASLLITSTMESKGKEELSFQYYVNNYMRLR